LRPPARGNTGHRFGHADGAWLGGVVAFKRGHLRYFVAVAEEGQITRAAKKVHIAQPALSQAIAQLESELGVELLKRHARGVTLTTAGETFLAKARIALAADDDAAQTARWLARAARGAMEVGFVGPPPTLNAPELFAAFEDSYPDAEVAFRDLPFPRGTTLSWLEEVDVAFCHLPDADPGVDIQAVRLEPRVMVAHKSHPLARREELAVAEVLDATFLSYQPDVQPTWAGFHSLDDHRGGPPRATTVERAANTMQMGGIMASGRGITTLPRCDAQLAQQVLPVVAIPLSDARPAVLSLTWRRENHNPLVRALVAFAGNLAESQSAAAYLSGD
jgi:DNA-binding transcriptional LysR family regulator